MPQLIIFVIVSIPILYISLPYLRRRGGYGFFRFFAFESVLILFVLNVSYWFREPFSALHLLSWVLLFASLALAIHGFYLLRMVGKPQGDWEATTHLVMVGAYRYIRHPLYASVLYFGWGTFFKDVSPLSIALVVALSVFLYATARVEEQKNLGNFGDEYAAYMKRSKMFVPFVV